MTDGSVCLVCIGQAMLLLLAANGAPVLANNLLGQRFAWAVDGGYQWRDGRPLFGHTKTWRGLLASTLMTGGVAVLWGAELWLGLLFGGLAMVGDLLSSFIKRRRGNVESSQARGLDTVPESLLPVWVLKAPLGLNFIDIVLVIGLFFLIEEGLSPLLYKLHIRKRPY